MSAPQDAPVWLSTVAREIHDLLDQDGALSRFRRMVRRWAGAFSKESDVLRDWLIQRQQHFQSLAKQPADAAVRDMNAWPPGRDWDYEDEMLLSTGKVVSGWVPPKLARIGRPWQPTLLPLGQGRELTLEEQYTVLAAVHDVALPGVSRIMSFTWERPEKLSLRKAVYRSLFHKMAYKVVGKLGAECESSLRVFLATVRGDLEKHEEEKAARRGCDKQPAETPADQSEPPRGTTGRRATRKLREPSEIKKKVAKLYGEFGHTQAEAAKRMNDVFKDDLGKLFPLNQHKVSRIVKHVNRWNKANNLPVIETRRRGSIASLDPQVIDMGPRVQQLTKRQRHRRE